MSWWTRIKEPPTVQNMEKQIQALRQIAKELGKTNLAGLSSWMRSEGLDYYDVLREFSP
jgi:phage terminase small subunit